MSITIQDYSKRFFLLFLSALIAVSAAIQSFTIGEARAEYHQAYIQATIDTSIWEIAAGVIDASSSFFETNMEYQRIGGTNLATLAGTATPSAASEYVDWQPSAGGGSGSDLTNLVMIFPGNLDGTLWTHKSSTSNDMARANLVRNSLIYDFNNAFKFVYGTNMTYTPAGSTIDERLENFAADMKSFLSIIPSGSLTVNGKSVSAQSCTSSNSGVLRTSTFPDSVTTYSDYVAITVDGETQYFLYRLPKGYVDISGRDITKLGLTKVTSGTDTKYVHWGHFAVEAFVNFRCDEKLQVTVDNVYNSTPNAFEKVFAGMLSSIANWIAGALGLWSFDDLFFNAGIRGTTAYVGGIFPTSWQPIIWALFFISEIAALVLLLKSILFTIGRKALATVNPIARASAIEQIQYLFIVVFALGLLPFALQLIINVSYELTGIFSDALGDKTAVSRFAGIASNSGGIGAVLTYIIYLGALIYFNVYYVFRSISIALLIIASPLCISCLGSSADKRQIAISWAREFMANLFIQPIHAILMCFILMVPATGRSIDSLVLAYILIPLSRTFRGLIFGNGAAGGDAPAAGAQNFAKSMGSKAWGMAKGAVAGGVSAGYNAATNGEGEGDGKEAAAETAKAAAAGALKGTAQAVVAPAPAAGGESAAAGPVVTAHSGASPESDNKVLAGQNTNSSTASSAAAAAANRGAAMSAPGPQSDDAPDTSVPADPFVGAGDYDQEPGPAPTDSATPSKHMFKGATLFAGAVAAGALGGGINGWNRRTFNAGGGLGGFLTQVSRKAGASSHNAFHPQNPVDTEQPGLDGQPEGQNGTPGMNQYSPFPLVTPDGQSVYDAVLPESLENATFIGDGPEMRCRVPSRDIGQHFDGQYLRQDFSRMGQGDVQRTLDNYNLLQQGSPEEQSAIMSRLGYTDMPQPIRNAQGELTGMQIPIDREKYAEVSGVSFNKDKTVTLQGPALVPSDSGYVAPQLVPDGVSAATHELERGEAERLYADMSSFVEGFGGSSSKSSGAFTFTIPTQSLDDVTSVYEGLNSVPAVSVNQSGADYTQFTLSASQMNQVTSPFRVDLEPSAPVQQIIESRSAAAEYIQTHPVTPPAPAPAMNAGAAPQPAFSSGAYTPLDMSQVNMDGPPPQRSDERRDIDRISRPPRAKFTT